MRRHLTYANVMATLAFAIAVAGGTAYAANTVFSSDIVNGEVKSVDIGTGQVRTADIGNDQVYSADVRDKTLPGGGLGGVDIRSDSLSGVAHIIDGSIGSADIEDGSIGSEQVGDGLLNDEDVGQAAFVDFVASIGTVNAQTCKFLPVTGIGAEKDHLLLTSGSSDTNPSLIYAVQYSPGSGGAAVLEACNPTALPANDGNSHFSLLLFDGD
jgi:hypothetical protein